MTRSAERAAAVFDDKLSAPPVRDTRHYRGSQAGGPFAYLSAYAFFQLPHGIFAVSLMTTLAPALAAAVTRQDWPGFRLKFARTLRLTLVVIGALNWLLIGLFDTNLVTEIFGTGTASDVVYVIIGVAGLAMLPRLSEDVRVAGGRRTHATGT